MQQVIELQPSDNLEKIVKDYSNSFKLIIFDFYADWCGPCKLIAKQLKPILQRTPEIALIKINIDHCVKISEQYNITSLPTFTFIRDNTILNSIVGANLNGIKKIIDDNINDDILIQPGFFNRSVVLKDIKNHLEYNGKTGICKGKKNRYIIKLEETGELVSIKEENFEFI
jgi:thiol-disulfide isomerase/thioredoxin